MTATLVARDTSVACNQAIPYKLNYPVAASASPLAGTIAVLNATGYATMATATTGLRCVGIFLKSVDNSAGADGDENAEIQSGSFDFENSAAADEITQAEVGNLCYLVDNQTVAKTSADGTRSIAGKVERILDGKVWVAMGLAFSTLADALEGSITRIQLASGTWVAGESSISTGITVTAATRAVVTSSAVITGSTNVGTPEHRIASNVAGGPGVGSIVINLLGDDGAIDADAAGTYHALLIN